MEVSSFPTAVNGGAQKNPFTSDDQKNPFNSDDVVICFGNFQFNKNGIVSTGAATAAATSRLSINAPSSSSSVSKPNVVFPTLKQDAAVSAADASSAPKPSIVFPTVKQDDAAVAGAAGAATSRFNTNASSSGSKPIVVLPTLEQNAAAAVDAESKKIKNQRPASQELASGKGKAKLLPENPIYGRSSIWGDPAFTTTGESPVLDVHTNTSKPLYDKTLCLKKQDFSHVASSSGQLKPLSTTSASSFIDELKGTNCKKIFLYEYGAIIDDRIPEPWEIEYNKQLNAGYDINNFVPMPKNRPATSNYPLVNQEPEIPIDLPTFEYILLLGSYEQKQKVLSMLKGVIIMLMIDKRLHIQRLFRTLVNACEGPLLNELAEDVLSNEENFINAMFCEEGKDSISKLMEKMRKTTHAYHLTRILANKFLHVATNRFGGMVIESCLMILGYDANKVLYEKAIMHYKYLATHKMGCRALNHCIKYIAGEQRSQLLNLIADVSDSLSFDPYGNYVVQNVMYQINEDVNSKILRLLQKHFLELSHLKGGSHVVETCMKTSDIGLVSVVETILVHPETAFRLAQDHFGNYVIQNALKMTRERGFSGLYNTLVGCLWPYSKALIRSKQGKGVLNTLNEGAPYQGQSAMSRTVDTIL